MKINRQKLKQCLIASSIFLSGGFVKGQCTIPTSVTANPSVVCSGATASLNATSVGNSINWFTVAVGGTPVGSSASGANFTLAPVTNTYYAESFAVGTSTFNYTGALQTFTVPAGVSQVTLNTYGAQGIGLGGFVPGNGGRAQGVLTVTPGQVLNIYVGGSNNYNGGGVGLGGAHGGGASDVRVGGIALANRVIVAGGGGGAAGDNWQCFVGAGHGGGGIVVGANFVGGGGGAGYTSGTGCGTDGGNSGGIGGSGTHGGGGGGGGFTSGGTGANATGGGGIAGTGSLGIGGNSSVYNGCAWAGAGGGGYYGGGGAAGTNCGAGRGGGGSSWTGTLLNPLFQAGVQTGNGMVIITYPSCVSASRTAVMLTVNPTPTITVNSGTICSGNSFTIIPSGANTYTIQGGNAVVSPTANANYTVVGTSSAGCVSQTYATAGVTINASPLPTITVNSGSVCAGSAFTIVPSGANTYTIQGGNAVVTPTANASYTVAGTNTAGCVSNSFATSSVTVAALPSVSVAGSGTICVGNATILTASGANTYSWNTGATTSTISVSPTVNATYTAMGTSSVSGCANSATASIVVSPCTGINNVSSKINGLSVYPNPSNGEFIVELNNGLNKTIEVTDVAGRIVLANTTSKDKVNVSISHLSNGIYYVKIQSNNLTEVIKVVKQ